MTIVSRERKLRLAWGYAAVGLLAAALLVVPAAAEADRGARYRYSVSQFDYNATGILTAGRATDRCAALETAGWFGRVDTGPTDLANPAGYGDGVLDIHARGTDGEFSAETEVQSTFGPAEHTLVTECDTDPNSPHYGQPTDSATTPCADGPKTSGVQLKAVIKGEVGDRVKINWVFRQVGVAGGWVPDIFRCVEEFDFPVGACKKQAKLDSFTKKKFTIPFRCSVQGAIPPPGYSQYAVFASATGSVELTRTKQS